MIRTAITDSAIDVAAALATHDAGGHGASASFIGRVRGDGGLSELMLEHHPALTRPALNQLAEAAARRWDLAAVTLVHRVGSMRPGDIIVLVLASSPHRAAALDACAFLIDRLKTDVPLWKRESFADGTQCWVEARTSDDVRAASWE
jgi:molybdopterin synthase catalytic subunit